MDTILEGTDGVTFRVRVQPRASKSELVGDYQGAVKLRITAAPVDGKANAECCRLLAKILDVSPAAVEIVSGEFSRDKIVRVHQVTAEYVRNKLLPVSH